MNTNTKTVAFESREDTLRREYAQSGCDWAYFVVIFLQGQRRCEIQPEEIVATKLYARSNELERRALDLVCETDFPRTPSEDDALRLRQRDQFLMEFVANNGTVLGHADLVAQLRAVPFQVARREAADKRMFPTTWESPKLFRWLFGER